MNIGWGMEEWGSHFCFACGIIETDMGRLHRLGSILRGSTKLESSRKEHEEGTRASTHQLQQGTFWLTLRDFFFFLKMVVIKKWYRLPREVVACLALEIFKPQLDTALRSLKSTLPPAGAGRGALEVLSSHNSSVMLWFVACKNVLQ